MLSRDFELENGASQNVGDGRKSPAILTASAALDSPLELSSPAIFPVSKGQDVPKDFPKGRPFEVSLQDSPDTIAYERTMSAIYDSYGRDRESKVDARISVHGECMASCDLTEANRFGDSYHFAVSLDSADEHFTGRFVGPRCHENGRPNWRTEWNQPLGSAFAPIPQYPASHSVKALFCFRYGSALSSRSSFNFDGAGYSIGTV